MNAVESADDTGARFVIDGEARQRIAGQSAGEPCLSQAAIAQAADEGGAGTPPILHT